MTRGLDGSWCEHLCVAYHSPADQLRAAQRFTIDALGGDERLIYVAAGPPEDDPIVDWLRRQAPPEQLQISRIDDVYAGDGRFDGPATVQAFRDLKATAQSEGFRTLRAMADLTALATNRATYDDLLAYELLIDEAIEQEGLHGLCFYDARAVAGRAAPLHCAHPAAAHAAEPKVAIRGAAVRLAGELDLAGRAMLATLLERVPANAGLIELDDLGFLDVAGANALANFVAERRARGFDVELRGGSAMTRLVLSTFGLGNHSN